MSEVYMSMHRVVSIEVTNNSAREGKLTWMQIDVTHGQGSRTELTFFDVPPELGSEIERVVREYYESD